MPTSKDAPAAVADATGPEAGPVGAADASVRWALVIPVKPTAVGKSRLADAGVDRVSLARAIALDTIAAAAAATTVERVIVVTDDAEVSAAAAAMGGVSAMPEGDPAGLEGAIAVGMRAAGPVARAALLGDLPALRPGDLDEALATAAAVERGLVTDAEGTGSTLVTARAAAVWLSAFGEGSAERHRLLGCIELDLPQGSTLRRDVDTAEQLAEASALGLGPRTAAVLESAAA